MKDYEEKIKNTIKIYEASNKHFEIEIKKHKTFEYLDDISFWFEEIEKNKAIIHVLKYLLE